MSIEHMTWVWNHSRAEAGTLLVALALADSVNHLGGNDECWPSLELLAHRVRLTERQVRRCIEQLIEFGELEKSRTQNGNHYRMLQPDTHVRSDRTPMSGSNRTPMSGPYVEPEVEPEKEPEVEGSQEALLPSPEVQVWQHYQATIADANRRKFDSARQTCVRRALRVRTVDECCRAIDALAASSFHNGENDQNKRYLDIQYALGLKSESADARVDKMIATLSNSVATATAERDVLARFEPDTQNSIYEYINRISLSLRDPESRALKKQADQSYMMLARMGLRPTFVGDRWDGWAGEGESVEQQRR